jgi:hypothetical protein
MDGSNDRSNADFQDRKDASKHFENIEQDSTELKGEKQNGVAEFVARPDVTIETFALVDKNKVLRKMDLRLVPMLTLLYLLSFLDRGNIGKVLLQNNDQPVLTRLVAQEMQRSRVFKRIYI